MKNNRMSSANIKAANAAGATAKDRIAASIRASKDGVFLRSEFNRFGDCRQISRAISALIQEGLIVRMGYGVYARATISPLSGKPVPKDSLVAIGLQAMKKLGVKADIGKDDRALQDGLSTQIPMSPVIAIGNARVTRKIGFGNRSIAYETDC
jgi:hypothetical protein